MEVKVMVQGPDTVHPIMVQVPDDEDPQQALSSAVAQGAPVVRLGNSSFRTDRVLGVVIQESFVDPSMRNTWQRG